MVKAKKINVTIIRSKWRTGGEMRPKNTNVTGKGDTLLVNSQGYKCCLGFIACEVRPSNKKVVGLSMPAYCNFPVPELHELIGGDTIDNTMLAKHAVRINDRTTTTQKEKEVELKELFKDSCYKLKFVD